MAQVYAFQVLELSKHWRQRHSQVSAQTSFSSENALSLILTDVQFDVVHEVYSVDRSGTSPEPKGKLYMGKSVMPGLLNTLSST